MKVVYEIRKFDLIGKVLYTYQERPDIEYRESNGFKRFYDKQTGLEEKRSYLWEYGNKPSVNAFSMDEKLLPYFADVTEDINPSYKIKPKTYKNCQLMSEKHGSYLQFWHEPTKQVLRIAMNSHTYQPVKQ